ncbi:MAG: exodeoxyribonuclease VII large subunit [Alphaproteobacteria bacterium]|nr:exodeoxyribonuclease VII large subunit [Alphaproteobacteria bacterium]
MDEFPESSAEGGAPPSLSNLPELTVSELAGQLKRTIEDAYGFVRVRGELGRVVVAKSGHVYFDIKDANATLNSVMWKGQAARLPFKPEEGLEVVAEGKLSTYPGRSNYQLIAERMRPAGLGALMQLLEERKKKLAAEGLFDADRKKPIPYLPNVIGVVTSPTGAVIRDIVHRVRERFPVRVIVWPALVQGERAAAEIEAGIRGFNAMAPGGPIPRPDVIIVARGGGSIEDLWPFNEERVARAASDSVIPLISAVGHETDTTLIDYVSDRRAPTPTGAAEIAVPVRADLLAAVMDLGARSGRSLTRQMEKRRLEFRSAAARLPKLDAVLQGPRQRLDLAAQKFGGALGRALGRKRATFDRTGGALRPAALRREVATKRAEQQRLTARLRPAVDRRLEQTRRRLETQARVLTSLSYEGVLKRGFALVTTPNGSLIRSAGSVGNGDPLRLRFADGEAFAVGGTGGAPPPSGRGKKKADEPLPQKPRIRRRKRPEDQGDLF